MHTEIRDRYCVIGAGPAGLTTAKNLLEQGLACDVLERNHDLGGNWLYGGQSSCLYKSVHMITSKGFSQYTDTPIPAELPPYLRWDQALAYLNDYARQHHVRERIEFERTVLVIEPLGSSRGWRVTLDGGETRRYKGVLVCNGHLSRPRLPEVKGEFDGLQLHASTYRTPELMKGKRVLVVGAGNSGCDIAVEAVHHASAVFHSTRRGYYFWPKFVFGIPTDEWGEGSLKMGVPLWMRRAVGSRVLRLFTAGQPEDYGLPKPDHKLFESHGIVNSTLLYHLGHGDIKAKRDVTELAGGTVRFSDGSEEHVDVIVWATGYELDFPFIEQRHLAWPKSRPELWMNIFDRQHEDLFFIGLFKLSAGDWPIQDYQAQLVAHYLRAL